MNNSRLPVIPSSWSAEEILLDSLCDQFEGELLKRDSPSVSTYIDRATGNIRAKLFRELLFLLLQYEELGQNYIPLKGMLLDFPQFESIIFDVYKQRRPSNLTIINKLFDTETDIPSDATIEGDEPSSFNVLEVVRIGKYSVLHHIDSGGQGDVFLARHPTLRKNVVIKLSRKTVAMQGNSRDRLVKEGQLLAKLNHRNLVRVIDLDFHEQRPFLVMDHLEGPSLREFSKATTLEPAIAVQWVIDLCYAVTEAHKQSIIHRDIKPANIVVVSGIPTLIDFGLAISPDVDSNIRDSGVAGTVSYMSPEQTYSDQSRIGPRTDVFGLGAVLFYLLQNQSPLRAANPKQNITVLSARQFDGATISSLVAHHPCHAVLVRALSNNPSHRFESAAKFARALAATQPELQPAPAITKRTALLAIASVLTIFLWELLTPAPAAPNPAPITSFTDVDYEVEFNLRDDTSNYLHQWNGVRLINEEELGEAKYWMPSVVGEWGFVTYRFAIPFEIGQAKVRAAISIFTEWRNDDRFDDDAIAKLDVSSDGKTWHQIAEVSKRTMQVGLETKLIDISRYVAGGTVIFVRARLKASKKWTNVGPVFAQFLRSPLVADHDGYRHWDAFHLQVTQCGQ